MCYHPIIHNIIRNITKKSHGQSKHQDYDIVKHKEQIKQVLDGWRDEIHYVDIVYLHAPGKNTEFFFYDQNSVQGRLW